MADNTQKQIALFLLFDIVLAGMLLLAALYDSAQTAPEKLLSIDYRQPVLRAIINFGVAAIAGYLLYSALLQNLAIPFKPIRLGFLISIVLIGLVTSLVVHYYSMVGWCCENPFAVFSGFPFSWLRAYPPNPYNYDWARVTLANALRNNLVQVRWQIQPHAFTKKHKIHTLLLQRIRPFPARHPYPPTLPFV